MVCLDDDTLCKPMSEREHLIYSGMPEVLRPFVPAFRGVMKVQVREKEDGYIELIGHPTPELTRASTSDTGWVPFEFGAIFLPQLCKILKLIHALHKSFYLN